MITQETTQDTGTKDTRIKELTEENKLLFEQLHVVQVELEKYYHKLKDCDQPRVSCADSNGSIVIIPPMLRETVSENLKLRALVAQQRAALQVESTNSLAARLGEMLIKGVRSTGSFIALPVRLCRMWKALEQTVPPAALGGTGFPKVLNAHATGGIQAVEKLLNSVFLSSVMRANAYTELARQVMLTDTQQAAELARLAWKTDPRPYRLKWLAFRLHEANDVINAEVMLDMLPDNTNMSDSEEQHANRIRQEATRERARLAQKTMASIQIESTQLQAAVATLKKTVSESKKQQATLAAQLNKQKEDHKQELEQRDNRIAALQKAADQAKQEVIRVNETQAILQRKMELQKEECDALALRTALMLKNMLTQFESDPSLLSRTMRVVMDIKER